MTDDLYRILQYLPEQSRTVLTLHYLEEFALPAGFSLTEGRSL